jgi:bacteriorhodopsin
MPEPGSIEKQVLDTKSNSVKFSFTVTYILLLTTATITIIEAIRTQNPVIRHVLNLETCISVVAGYFYSAFMLQIDESEKKSEKYDWSKISQTRYLDWSITTPIMLLVLCIVLGNNIHKPVTFGIFAVIVLLNFLMLFLGYLGETHQIDRFTASFLGFVPFFGMFYLIFSRYVLPRYRFDNYVIYSIYVGIWSMYGVVYLLEEEGKNIAMNILDLISKCGVGLGLWAYYVRIFAV